MPNVRIEFAVAVDGTPEQPISAHGFLFDGRGRLLARAPLAGGVVAFDVDSALLGRARLVLAPADAGLPAAPSLEALRRVGAYEPPMTLTPEVKRYELKPLPPEIWKRWLLCRCLVQGTVVRPVTVGPRTLDLPVCHARVHICEVDPWPLLIAKIPDLHLLRVREELLRPRPEPGPLRRVAPGLRSGLVRLETIHILPFAEELADGHVCGGGRHRFAPAADYLDSLKAQGKTRFLSIAKEFAARFPQRGLLIIISDFLGEEEWEKSLQYLADIGHELLLLHVFAPEDRVPPWSGELDVVDAESGEHIQLSFEDDVRQLYTERFDDYARGLRDLALRKGGRFISLSTDTSVEEAVFGPLSQAQAVY